MTEKEDGAQIYNKAPPDDLYWFYGLPLPEALCCVQLSAEVTQLTKLKRDTPGQLPGKMKVPSQGAAFSC